MIATLIGLALAMSTERPPMLIHTMPWFEPGGWHWTMNKTWPEGRVASHFRPIIGAYDSADPLVVELHVAWMKLAGFDGVLADWYGIEETYDYPMIHRRTQLLFETATRAGMTIGIVYEDQSIGNPIKNGVTEASQSVPLAGKVGHYLGQDWLKRRNWWRIDGKPVIAVFGPQHFGDLEWASFREGTGPIQLLTLHDPRPGSDGVFDWPLPARGLEWTWDWPERRASEPIRVTVAFPRFLDFYEEGGQEGHPDLPDQDGSTYRRTLEAAIEARPKAIQVATWNDWQEGTQIEPSVEFGMRDLVETQRARKRLDPTFAFTSEDLELPLRLYRIRAPGDTPELAAISSLLLRGEVTEARKRLDALPG